MAIKYGKAVCWGMAHAGLPIANLPPGVLKVRTRFRNDRVAAAFLKFDDRIEQWRLAPFEDGTPKAGETFAGAKQIWLTMHKGTNATNAKKR